MYPVSQAYLQAIQSTTRTKALKVHIDTYLESFDLTDADIQQATTKLETSCLCGNIFGLGGVFISDFSISLLNRGGRFDDTQFNGALLTAQDGTQLADGTFEWVPLGTLNIDDVSRPTSVVTLLASDNLILFDQPFEKVPITFPATCLQILSAVCAYCGVLLRTTSFINSGYMVQSAPDGSMSCRDVVSDIAELAAGFARCDYTGGLEIVQFQNPGCVTEVDLDGNTDDADGGDFTHWNNRTRDGGVFNAPAPAVSLDTSNRFDFKIDDSPITITGIELETDEKTYLVGSDYYAIHITDNKLIQGDPTAVLNNIYDALYDFTFLPFTSNWQGNPALQCGDIIQQTDRNDVVYNTIVTNSTYVYRGSCQLSAKGASQLSNGYQSQLTKKVSQLNHKIQDKQNQINALDLAIQNATNLIAGALGGHVVNGDTLPDEKYHGNIFICDNIGNDPAHPDVTKAVKVWRWNLGGFGYSSTGINGPYTTAITADDSIIAAIITANMIKTGILQSLNGESWIDLDNGSFDLGNGALHWDKVNGFKAISAERITSAGSTTSGKIGDITLEGVTYRGLEIDSNDGNHLKVFLSPTPSGDGLSLCVSNDFGAKSIMVAEVGATNIFRPVVNSGRYCAVVEGGMDNSSLNYESDDGTKTGRVEVDEDGAKFYDNNGIYGFTGEKTYEDFVINVKNGIVIS